MMWPSRSNRAGNPYNALLSDALEAAGCEVCELDVKELVRRTPAVVHVHWPEWALQRGTAWSTVRRASPFLAAVWLARRRGARLVWTVHNVRPHDRASGRVSRLAWSLFTDMVDGVVALSPSVGEQARAEHPRLASRPLAVVPHGHYRDAYPGPPERVAARRRLGLPLDRPVLLFVGQIRPYKGIEELLEAFAASEAPATLVVAGRVVGLDDGFLRRAADSDPRVHVRLGYVVPEDLVAFLAAADLVVLPYSVVSTSGSAMLALSFDRPLLCPGAGALQDLAVEVGDTWVRTYQGALTAEVLDDAIRWGAHTERHGRAPLAGDGWAEIAQRTIAAYRAAGASDDT